MSVALRIYVDFDDVICETARDLARLAASHYNRRVPYEAIRAFNLREAFTLDEADYLELMAEAHRSERLLALQPTPGAVTTLQQWLAAGAEVEVVTGRPWATYSASREWLVQHGLATMPLIHVDKYGREPRLPGADAVGRALTVAEFLQRRYDLAVEDAPPALELLRRLPQCRILVYDRPWNRQVALEPPAVVRCHSWSEIAALPVVPAQMSERPQQRYRLRS